MLSFFFDITNQSAKDIKDWLYRISERDIPIEFIQITLDILALIVFVIAIAWLLLYFYKGFMCIKTLVQENKSWRNTYMKENIPHEFLPYKHDRLNKRCYIKTRIQTDDPSKFEEPYSAIANTVSDDFIAHFVNKIFKDENEDGRLYCILAGSGMGKSTALVNLFISYLLKYNSISKMPFQIRLFSLANGNVMNSIAKVDNKQNTILLLDALDENVDAVDNLTSFMEKLEVACSEFRFVVLSCRTQFFPDESAQLKESKLIKDGAHKGYVAYTTFYISPFNDSDIKLYMKKVFTWWQWRKRRKATSIINNRECRYLLVRPMILSHIKQLADDNRTYRAAVDVYDAIVEYWLEREVGRETQQKRNERKEILRFLSKQLAENIYQNKDRRKGYYITREEFNDFLLQNNIDNSVIHFRERSLINRDALGYIKFSHKSFLEYFVAYKCALGEMYISDFTGMDIALKMYKELCERYFKESLNDAGNDLYYTPPSKNDYNKKVSITKMKNFATRWFDFLLPTYLVTTSKLIKDILKEDDLLWYNQIETLEILINDSKDGYLKFIKKLANLKYVKVRGDIGMKKTKFFEKIMQMFPYITIELNYRIVIHEGKNVIEQRYRIPEELLEYVDMFALKNIDNIKNIRHHIQHK
ncbi:MAG: hypothetical protein IKV04_05020 [Alistipes sp.]|nr:hypothetical protein [Alistipes sp.]